MKLWKSKKSLSCMSSNTAPLKSDECHRDGAFNGGANSIPLTPLLTVDRAMSPAQSEDSGLAPERGTTYATIILPRNNDVNMGITFVERNDLSLPPVVATLSLLGTVGDFLAPGDRIHQIDSISTIGISNAEVMSLLSKGYSTNNKNDNSNGKLCDVSSAAVVEIEYSLPECVSRSSLCVSTKFVDIAVERESGCLGLTLRGGGDLPLIITYVRPNGPVSRVGRVKAGDRLLRINNMSLVGKTLAEAQHIIKFGSHLPGSTILTIEYDVSIVQMVEYALGPLLIEIERPMNDKLGLILCNYPLSATSSDDQQNCDEILEAGVFIESILPASIAERCGALSSGDQILSVDETVIGHNVCTPDEVTKLLCSHNGRPYIQLQIMPVNAILRRGCHHINSPKHLFNTMECRKSRTRQRFIRKSSLPLESSGNVNYSTSDFCGSSPSNMKQLSSTTSNSASTDSFQSVSGPVHHTMNNKKNICREESFMLMLDCSHKSGIILDLNEKFCEHETMILKILPDSAADICGCLQEGDRIVAINNIYSLDPNAMQNLLDGKAINGAPNLQFNMQENWLQLEVKFDLLDSVVPSSGVFTVKLKRLGEIGFGISIRYGGTYGGVVISDVKPGSTAHRTGSIKVGDVLLAIDNHSLQNFNAEALLYGCNSNNNNNEFTTLTIKRMPLPDFMFDTQQKTPTMGLSPDFNNYDINSSSSYDVTTNSNDISHNKTSSPPLDFLRESSFDKYQNMMYHRHTTNSNTWSPNADKQLRSANNTQISDYKDNNSLDFDNNFKHMVHSMSAEYSSIPPAMENNIYATGSKVHKSSNETPIIFTVRLEGKGGLHGIVLAGNEDGTPITISEIVEGGSACKSRQLKVGDQLLAINEEPVQGLPLSYVTKLLQTSTEILHLQLLRKSNYFKVNADVESRISQNQALYAKVVRRVRSPSFSTNESGTSSKEGNKNRIFHVTLYKDKVYDDYGFSVSDGLYERGVFINRIRSGGSADLSNALKPFDRIIQVNDLKTLDFDCCLTVPLIAAAGDKIELIVQRSE